MFSCIHHPRRRNATHEQTPTPPAHLFLWNAYRRVERRSDFVWTCTPTSPFRQKLRNEAVLSVNSQQTQHHEQNQHCTLAQPCLFSRCSRSPCQVTRQRCKQPRFGTLRHVLHLDFSLCSTMSRRAGQKGARGTCYPPQSARHPTDARTYFNSRRRRPRPRLYDRAAFAPVRGAQGQQRRSARRVRPPRRRGARHGG